LALYGNPEIAVTGLRALAAQKGNFAAPFHIIQ
jgi:hypothetical protein